MSAEQVDDAIRRAIGGDAEAIAWLRAVSADSDSASVVTMAALLDTDVARLDQARRLAATSADRQVVEIARAHLEGRRDQVDALARDHLVDHPDALVVAWIAAGARVGPRNLAL